MSLFSTELQNWYAENARSLPWRATKNPYFIWLSEVILQQTRVQQGKSYYHKFVERFPNVTSLAQAEEQTVLNFWQGLGYYSRARNMHKTAKFVAQFGKGHFDNDRFKNCGCFKAFLVALSDLLLYISHGRFTFVKDGELVIIPEKEITKSYVLDFLHH